MIRQSKMVIYSRDFRWHEPYAGVFICDNDKGNAELRKMESPQHDEWDKNRYKEKGEAIDLQIGLLCAGRKQKTSEGSAFFFYSLFGQTLLSTEYFSVLRAIVANFCYPQFNYG